MSTKCDIWSLDRLRFYFEWHDQSLRLGCYDKTYCADDNFNFALSADEWRAFAESILKGLDQYGKHICTHGRKTEVP